MFPGPEHVGAALPGAGLPQLQAAINAHTTEDATHSRLYVQDWRALGFDERLGFSAADTLWWLSALPHTRPFRDRLPVLAGIAAADRGDPVLRFVQAEAIEASGNAFFAGVTPVAEQFSTLTGALPATSASTTWTARPGTSITGTPSTASSWTPGSAPRRCACSTGFSTPWWGSSTPAMSMLSRTPGPACCRARAGIPAGGPNGRTCLVCLADHGVLLPQPRHGSGPVSAAGAPALAGSSLGRRRSRARTPTRWYPE